MTRKRYGKLMYALAQRMINDSSYYKVKGKGGMVLRGFKNANPISDGSGNFKSYQEAWEHLMPVRELYGFADVTK